MSPNIQRKRYLILVGTAAAIVLLVIFIVVLWVLQGSGAFDSSSDRKRTTAGDNSTVASSSSEASVAEVDITEDETFKMWMVNETCNDTTSDTTPLKPPEHHHNHNNDPNVQFVTPYKISPPPLHHNDLLYVQMNNETTGESRYHSGNFRHKTALIWDPHPEYEIVAFGKKLHLNLELNDDVPKNIHITHIYSNYSRKIVHDPRTSGCFYRGTIKGDVNSSVSVSLCHGMTGRIHTSTGNYYITPVENSTEYLVNNTLKHKIVKETFRSHDQHPYGETRNASYSEEKIIIDDDFLPDPESERERSKRDLFVFDELDHSREDDNTDSKRLTRGIVQRHRFKSARTKRTDHEYFIEVLVVADKNMVEYHGHREKLVEYILILMAHVGVLFKDATIGNPITLMVVHISILNDTEFTYNRSDQMLKKFCEWQRDHNSHIPHDAAILLTRNVICKNMTTGVCHTLGIAEVGGMCSESSSCAIVRDNGLSTSYTIAHEMGHLLNMRHDDYHKCSNYNGDNKPNIMSKVLHNDTKPWQWSACSRHYLTEFLDSPRAACLLGKPKVGEFFPNAIPGENFEANLQCELEFGSGSKICSFMQTCSSLWCTSESGEEAQGCRTQHLPWADGTSCGDGRDLMWCHHGRCIPKIRQNLAPRNGIWGPWQPWGKCSRSCGGGIKIRKRECDQPPPANGGSYCRGQSTSYASCNTQECPSGTRDYREEQCGKYDGDTKGIAGLTPEVKWVPKYGITDEHDLCRLFCRVKGTNEYYRLEDKVEDGTKCSINSFDICVNGKCLPGGCDNTLNSTATLDECGVCNGDNSTCQEVLGRYNTSTRGYARVVRIPKGSSNLVIEQHGYYGGVKDDNYLALVDGETGEYVLNGNFIISSWKHDLVYGGLTLAYSGSEIQIERLTTPKNRKLKKDLVLEVLSVTSMPPDIRYRYTINKDMAPKFGWQLYESNWTECSAICRGIQYMRPVCLDLANYAHVSPSRCSDLSMDGLVRERQCNMHCKLDWNATKSGICSVHCGSGWQEVNFNCVRIDLVVPDGKIIQAVDDMHCSNLHRPPSREACTGPCDVTHWQYTAWSQCSKSCGGGIKTRTAICVDDRNNTIDESHCYSKKKYIEHTCNNKRCPTWTYADWTTCSKPCGKGHRSRKYYCSLNGQVINNAMCNRKDLRIEKEECELTPCQWFAGNWTACSVRCGDGVKTREVECRAGPRKVYENHCRDLLKPHNQTDCAEAPCERFDSHAVYPKKHENEISNDIYSYYHYFKWEMGTWSECSRSCGGGTKSRLVVCRDGQGRESENYCEPAKKPPEYSRCNGFQCPQWRTGDWTSCNAFCERNRMVGCFNRTEMVSPAMCDQTRKPESSLRCNAEECNQQPQPTAKTRLQHPSDDESRKNQRYRWKKTGWTPCSKTCGDGIRYRNVTCQRVFPGGIIQDGVNASHHKCDPYTKPATNERCHEKNCSDPYSWRTDAWSKCGQICGVKSFQVRRLHCINQRGQKVPRKFCRRIGRPERKRRCPIVYCTSCREIQQRTKAKQNKDYFLKLYGKLAQVYCYKMDTKEPEEYVSLHGGKENYAQYYDYRIGMLSQTTFWKVRLDPVNMRIIRMGADKMARPPNKQQCPVKRRQLCVCKSMRPSLVICRWLGMFPITTRHDEYNRCIFTRNNKWYAYSVAMTLISLIRVFIATDFFNIFEIGRKKSLHPIIASLNDVIYSLYITGLAAINIYRCPKFVETLNRSAIMTRESLYCQSSRKSVLAVQYGVLFIFFSIAFAKFGAIFYVHLSESYDTGNFDYKIYSNAIIQSEIFTMYVVFIAMSSMLMGMYGCYERFAMKCLDFTPIHPLQDVDETNNIVEFMGLVDYKLCDELHPVTGKIRKLPLPETIEYLRCLHEEICVTMYDMNECLNPQFLVHVTVELMVLILNWYAVIMYMAYVFLNPIARTLHFLNICFVIIHTLGLLVFLKQAQQLQTVAGGLINLLLEYSTRISTADEHQQIRIFIEKMKGQRPLTASGVFDIDLGIAGPVCANIVTYVLVALQFDVPKT